MSCKLKKNKWDPNSPLFFLYFKDCVMIQCLILLFSVIYFDSWGYIRLGPPSGYLKSFVLSFLPFLFFSFSFFFFLFCSSFSFFCLSLGGPFSAGAPGHCPPMPPRRYATAIVLMTKTDYKN